MTAPFYKFGMFTEDFSLVVAFVIGIGFGFALERAGFGSARKLTAQFYFKDLAVFKVMFTAIVTAMVGIFYLTWIGFLDLSLIYTTPTFIVPQAVGGFILGIGFVVGGYCPGTSAVAAITGRLDAMVYLGGVVLGIFIFGETYPVLGSFFNSTAMGNVSLPGWSSLSHGLIVFLVILMAVGGFTAAEWWENKLKNKKDLKN